jgi:hypothetical protein
LGVVAVEGTAAAEGLRGIPIRRAFSSLSSVVVVIWKWVFGFEVLGSENSQKEKV